MLKLKNGIDGQKQLEIPHVVKLKKHYAPCGVQKCFTFNHPRLETQKNNKRFEVFFFQIFFLNLIIRSWGVTLKKQIQSMDLLDILKEGYIKTLLLV